MNHPTDRAARPGDESYDAIVARLERVVGELESGQLSLEQSIEKFAEGIRLARDASRKLDEAERRVEQLVRSADGEDEAVPLDPPPPRAGKLRGGDEPSPSAPRAGKASRAEDGPEGGQGT